MHESPFLIEKLPLPGVLLIRPKVWSDTRGFSVVPYDSNAFREAGIPLTVVYEYTSFSKESVLRGLHFQKAPYGQDKLVRCSSGEIFDVAADINPESPTYGKYISASLKAEEQAALFIPGKYAHGFCVVSDDAVVEYKLGTERSAEHERGVRWNDPALGITWPVTEPLLSEKDKAWPLLSSVSRPSELS